MQGRAEGSLARDVDASTTRRKV